MRISGEAHMTMKLLGWGTFLLVAIFLPVTLLVVEIRDYTATDTIIMVGGEIVIFVFVAVGIVGHEIIQKINRAKIEIIETALRIGGETIDLIN